MIINQIGQGGGLEPTGTITITNNGSYSVTPYANAEVNVAGGGTPIVLDELNVTPSISSQTLTPPTGTDGYNVVNVDAVDSTIDSNIQPGNIKEGINILGVNGTFSGADSCLEFPVINGAIKSPTKGINIGDATSINDSYVFYDVCGFGDSGHYSNSIKGSALLNSSKLTTINGNSAFYRAFKYQQGITSTGLNSVKTISGSWVCYEAFNYCSSLTKSGLTNLETISGSNACYSMFHSCTSLTDIELRNLKTIDGFNYYMFAFCTGITIAEFDSLESLPNANSALYRMFWRCTNLKNIYFPALKSTSFGGTSAFNQMLQDVTGCIVHFPSNLQSVIGSWSDVTSGFGGTNTTVLYDLPATA